ncbi:hypothetical protein Trydic_g17647 [Trypoxylus dichotomus]
MDLIQVVDEIVDNIVEDNELDVLESIKYSLPRNTYHRDSDLVIVLCIAGNIGKIVLRGDREWENFDKIPYDFNEESTLSDPVSSTYICEHLIVQTKEASSSNFKLDFLLNCKYYHISDFIIVFSTSGSIDKTLKAEHFLSASKPILLVNLHLTEIVKTLNKLRKNGESIRYRRCYAYESCTPVRSRTWIAKSGWRRVEGRVAILEGDPEYPKPSERSQGADYASKGFHNLTLNL